MHPEACRCYRSIVPEVGRGTRRVSSTSVSDRSGGRPGAHGYLPPRVPTPSGALMLGTVLTLSGAATLLVLTAAEQHAVPSTAAEPTSERLGEGAR